MMPAPPTLDEYRLPPSPGAREGGSRPRPEGSPDQPLVSIVTVVFNGERTLQATIDSVVAQDYPAIEYIVLDGGSTDGTLDILTRNERHITYWRSEPDRGIYDAMNKGIALARGTLIKLLNADDLLCPNSVRHAVTAYQNGASGGVIRSDMELIDEDGRFIKLMDAARGHKPFGGVVHPSWYTDRGVYEQYGLYLPYFRISGDYELFARLRMQRVPFFSVGVPLVRFRTGGASSALGGLKERFRANRFHAGTWPAFRGLFAHGFVKLRGRLLRKLLDEHGLARLQRWIRPETRHRR